MSINKIICDKFWYIHTVEYYPIVGGDGGGGGKRNSKILPPETMSKSQKHVEWKQVDTEEYLLCDSIYMTFKNRDNQSMIIEMRRIFT